MDAVKLLKKSKLESTEELGSDIEKSVAHMKERKFEVKNKLNTLGQRVEASIPEEI